MGSRYPNDWIIIGHRNVIAGPDCDRGAEPHGANSRPFPRKFEVFRPAGGKLLILICPTARQKNLSRGLEIVKRVLIDDADDLKAKPRNLGSLCVVYRTASGLWMPFEQV
jgi:hypothetical protein